MMTLLMAAAVAAQPVPSGNAHSQMGEMKHEQQETKKDCCEDCCKHMADEHGGQSAEHGNHAAR